MAETVKIVFESDVKGLQQAETALEDLGKTEKKVAEQFKEDNKLFVDYSKKRQEEIKKEEAAIERLRQLRKKSFNTEDIKFYNNEIALAKKNIQLLGGSYQSVSNGARAALKEQVALNASLKQGSAAVGALSKGYGFLRQAANIIPGLGISGVILLGYEALIGLVDELGNSFGNTNSEIEENKKLFNEITNELIKFHNETVNVIGDQEDLADQVKLIYGQITEAQLKENRIIRESNKVQIEQQRRYRKTQLDIIQEFNEKIKPSGGPIVTEQDLKIDSDALQKKIQQIRDANEIIFKLAKEQSLKSGREVAPVGVIDIKPYEEFLKKILQLEKDQTEAQKAIVTGRRDALTILYDETAKAAEEAAKKAAENDLKIKIESEKEGDKILDRELKRKEKLQKAEEDRLKKEQDARDKARQKEKEAAAKAAEEDLEIRMQQAEDELDFIEEQEEYKSQLQQQFKRDTFDAVQSITDAFADAQIKDLQQQLDAQQISQEQFEEQVKQVKRRAAITDKLLSLFNIGLNTAEAVQKSIAISPATFGQPFAGFALASGALQAAVVAAKPIPFAKGTKSVKGGVAGKDSVHALLMPDEMVIPVDKKRKYQPILNAIFDEKISPDLLNKMALNGSISFGGGNSPIDSYLIKDGMSMALRNGVYIKNMPKQNDNISVSEIKLLKRRGII